MLLVPWAVGCGVAAGWGAAQAPSSTARMAGKMMGTRSLDIRRIIAMGALL